MTSNIKRLLCWHDWILISQTNYESILGVVYADLKCEKCGKQKLIRTDLMPTENRKWACSVETTDDGITVTAITGEPDNDNR